ncbi:ImmA/IrrE family metallo-endopeptidase [Roseobacter weihaiensis]|uniref:ImmA/IrrE family metallo-endopeptidase n=1 Tax=Roseobacter weihaiensis TaxID=2763262 RepID=UPI001D09BC8A|nr:ImmA/IrrE family metallo-endopeptidase [Roseobacter sp. H9]
MVRPRVCRFAKDYQYSNLLGLTAAAEFDEKVCNMPARRLSYPYVEPDAAHQTRLEIEVLADRYAHEWGYRSGKSLDEVCKTAGVDIEYSHRPNEIMLEIPLEERPVIWLPRTGRKRDDRFIIATALGHWAIHVGETRKAHPGCGIQALYEPDSNEALEEAKAFGMAFLMPTQAFIDSWCQGRSQAASIRFDVPTKIAYLRAKSLELGDTV